MSRGGDKDAEGLTIKQRLFVEHYIATRSAFLAAKEAGYNGDDKTLRAVASENLTKPVIRQAVDLRLKEVGLTTNQVIAGLSYIADSDIAEVFEPDGSFDLASCYRRGKSRLIKSLTLDKDTGRVTKVEMYSAHEGYRDLGKRHGLFPTQIKVTTEEVDKTINQAVEAHNLPKPETFGGEPVVESEM